MSEIKELPARQDVPTEMTWRIEDIFATDADFDKAYLAVEGAVEKIADFKGTLGNNSDALLAGIHSILNVSEKFGVVYTYAHLRNDQDTSNSFYQGMHERASALGTKLSAATSWFEPELLAIPEATLTQYLKENAGLKLYQHFIDDITSARSHVLSEKEEALLAGAGDIFDASARTFSVLNNADIQFPKIKDAQGRPVQLSHGVYGQLMENTNRQVRESAFKEFNSTYKNLKNTFASTLSSNVKYHNYDAEVHNYSSARAKALAANHIPESVHDTLLAVVKNKLPLLHRYVGLRKEVFGVDQLHMYDMYTPLTGEASIRYTYEEAVEVAKKALAPLGEDYLRIVTEAFSERWVDVVENKGKRSGAYSSGTYGTNPYILMNWHESLDQLYTLVHEMGHSVHSYYTRNNQPYVYGNYSIFLAEIASTTNENLLTEYLLETQTDPEIRAYVLNRYLDGFKGTIFRQTQFAEFEHYIHEQAAAGVPLTSEFMTNYYADLNAAYYGPAVARDPEIAYEWARIPHFYYNYYVYQYATGFSAASTLAEGILAGKEGALEAYLTYLKAGCSDYPIEVMKKAGVDMTKKAYIEDALQVFETRLTELETLLKK
ncbi:oligoendopeptidase F [Isobaculum melis]|uniref:Oligopeptidase F n=1 Tax=Isobaculum melis TaxID=142588 RepID=A0A1H9TAN6_9LACT|nr:oligoendopeptidase F [Isobaculum melis]SER93829.1 oligopeptidase F. Metallo peptidase. MEROPS family M03B [Isobaculum melis]